MSRRKKTREEERLRKRRYRAAKGGGHPAGCTCYDCLWVTPVSAHLPRPVYRVTRGQKKPI